MKKSMLWMLVLLVCALCLICFHAIAEDGHNMPDQLGDIFTGRGNTYGGVEIINIPLPVLEMLTLTVWADAMVGKIDDGVEREVRGGAYVVVDWQKMFK